jgi:LytS/YehU family sensor histidine kinase
MEDTSYLLIVFLIIIVVWLWIKLSNAKGVNTKLGKLNTEFINYNKQLLKENHKLIADNALLEADHLNFQLQPHTLNNILAHLKITANKLNLGLSSLSETLEYILYKGKSHLVSVEEEMSFIKEYLQLNELFIHELDAIDIDYSKVDRNSKYFSSPCIPHLISAYFVENAFKHGVINSKAALKVIVILNDREFVLTVQNKISPHHSKGKGGIGLKNMKNRLELLVPNRHDIQNSSTNEVHHSTLTIKF